MNKFDKTYRMIMEKIGEAGDDSFKALLTKNGFKMEEEYEDFESWFRTGTLDDGQQVEVIINFPTEMYMKKNPDIARVELKLNVDFFVYERFYGAFCPDCNLFRGLGEVMDEAYKAFSSGELQDLGGMPEPKPLSKEQTNSVRKYLGELIEDLSGPAAATDL